MSAPLQRICGSFRRFLTVNGDSFNDLVREASKKAGGSSKNKQVKTRKKRRGAKKVEGDYVERGMILYRQIGLRCYPGENVGCGRDLTLFALSPGKVIVSREKLSPFPYSPLYNAVKQGRDIYKLFYHVLPDSQPNKFRLVSQT